MEGPLDGIKIIDFTRYQQGPFATVMLSDLGADVIKIEERRNGDLGRTIGMHRDGWCTYFEAHNRNKRSITIDVRTDSGKEIVRRLVAGADVVTDNFRPGVMKRLGLDWESLSKVNPRIITASASGFGPKGPSARRPSFDVVGQAWAGIMTLQGGGPGTVPQSLGAGAADQIGAMIFAVGICSALVARELQGIGQHVDVSLLGSQLALQGLPLLAYLKNDQQAASPQRLDPLFTYFPCGDDLYISIGVLDPRWWPPLCQIIGREDLLEDERFETASGRHRNREPLLSALDTAFRERTRAEWLTLLDSADIPCGPVNDYEAVANDPQVLENEYITSLEHPKFGDVRVVGSPIKMSNSDTGPRHSAPELGQHTDEILVELGYSQTDIAAFRQAEAI
ncbi:MAG TPA: CoA transferase [Dehalococcoidia bacterium]|nr:CoA transferase [Dehalococcoidia bacterium]